LLTKEAEYPFSSGVLPILQSPESFSVQLLIGEHYVEAVRTTKHPSSKIVATHKKSPLSRRHSTCKVARAPRSHDFYDVNVVGGVPTVVRTLLEHPDFESFDLSSITSIGQGGAPVPPTPLLASKQCSRGR